VTQYISKYETHSGTDHALLPVPEPSVLGQAAAINFDDLQHELNRLHAAVEGFYWVDWFDFLNCISTGIRLHVHTSRLYFGQMNDDEWTMAVGGLVVYCLGRRMCAAGLVLDCLWADKPSRLHNCPPRSTHPGHPVSSGLRAMGWRPWLEPFVYLLAAPWDQVHITLAQYLCYLDIRSSTYSVCVMQLLRTLAITYCPK